MVSDIHELLEPIGAQNLSDGGRAVDIAPLNDLGVPVMSLKVEDSSTFGIIILKLIHLIK